MISIAIEGEITNDKVKEFGKEIAKLKDEGCPDIIVLISSKGGEVESGFDIYDLLRLYPGKKTGIVWRYAKSMASFILQACDERYVTPHSRILIHHISRTHVSLDILRNPKRIKEVVTDLERLQSMMYKVYASRTGKTVGQIRQACTKEEDLYPVQAKEFGLIDGVWTKSLPMEVLKNKK